MSNGVLNFIKTKYLAVSLPRSDYIDVLSNFKVRRDERRSRLNESVFTH
jgi:hypothetical protein